MNGKSEGEENSQLPEPFELSDEALEEGARRYQELRAEQELRRARRSN